MKKKNNGNNKKRNNNRNHKNNNFKPRKEENKKSLYEFLTMLEDVATPESLPKDEGDNKTIAILKAKASVKKS